jgi:DUF1680 family protein
MDTYHFHFHNEGLDLLAHELRQGFDTLFDVMHELGEKMSDAADNLTAAVAGVQTSVDNFNTTLQAEVEAIAMALEGTGTGADPALEAAAQEAISRLNAIAAQMDQLNTTVQNIVP